MPRDEAGSCALRSTVHVMPQSFSCGWRIVLACFLVSVGTSTWADDPVHKCRDKDGAAMYQATPCAATQRTEWVRDYPPDPPSPVASTAEDTIPSTGAAMPRSKPSPRKPSAHGAMISIHRDPNACEAAKEARDRAYARLGLKRDFATSRRFDDRVADACR